MRIKKYIIIIVLILGYHTIFAQYDFIKVEFEFEQALEANPSHQINIAIYKPDSTYIITVKSKILKRNKRKVNESKIDTFYQINKVQFNKISEMVTNLSSKQIVKGMLYNPHLFIHPCSISLRITLLSGEKMSFLVFSPKTSIEERNLKQFLVVCKEILLLAKMNPKDFF